MRNVLIYFHARDNRLGFENSINHRTRRNDFCQLSALLSLWNGSTGFLVSRKLHNRSLRIRWPRLHSRTEFVREILKSKVSKLTELHSPNFSSLRSTLILVILVFAYMYFFVHLVDSIALYLQIYKNFFFFSYTNLTSTSSRSSLAIL